MAPVGRRASMRSVRTLPVVHEDEANPSPDHRRNSISGPHRPRQNRFSGTVTAMPPLLGGVDFGSSSSEEDTHGPGDVDDKGTGTAVSATHRRSRLGGSGSSNGSQRSSQSRRSSVHHQSPYHQRSVPAPSRTAVSSGNIARVYVPGGLHAPVCNTTSSSEGSDESGGGGTADRKLELAVLPGPVGVRRSQDDGWFAKRGGWYRLVLTLVLLAAIAVGLGVGLKFGLENRSLSDGDDNDNDQRAGENPTATATAPGSMATAPSAAPPALFPAGSFAVTVALANVSAACTTDRFTFGCAPGTVFDPTGDGDAQNVNKSTATFYWVIAAITSGSTGSASTSTTYKISSSDNDGSHEDKHIERPTFQDVQIDHLDAGLASERLIFQTATTLAYVPTEDLVKGQTSAATCYYKQTQLTATLWLQRNATVSAADGNKTTAAASSPTPFAQWPFAAEITATQPARYDVPSCVDIHGNQLGNFSVGTKPNMQCGCWYANVFDE